MIPIAPSARTHQIGSVLANLIEPTVGGRLDEEAAHRAARLARLRSITESAVYRL